MAITTKSVALFLLLSFFLLSLSLADPSTSKPELESESEQAETDPSTAVDSDIQETYRTVVLRPADQDGPVDPDLIAHSFRLPSEHHHRFRHGHRHHDHHHHHHHHHHGLIRMKPEGGPHRGFGEEFPVERRESEPEEEEEERKKRRDEHDSESDSDEEDEFEHKRMRKMKRMRRFGDEEEMEGWGFVDRVRHFLNW